MRRFITFLALILIAGPAAAETPFQFAAPGVRAPDDPDVNGIRFSVFHGTNRSVRGADFGFLSLSETSSLTGFAGVAGFARLRGDMRGCSSAVVNVHSGRDRGLNAAFVNRTHTMAAGANVAFVNIADDYTMIDIGGLNVSNRSTVQLGFLNVTTRIEGVQIGFLNVAENGFLPVFPFFNFPKN